MKLRESVDRLDISDKPHMILWDGHDSHETVDIIDLAIELGIHLFCFPSKTTHKLQPLDVSCFSSLKHYWRTGVINLNSRGIFVHPGNVVETYLEVSRHSMTHKNILLGFRKTGIHPFNPKVFTKRDFAPSHPYSTQRHLPDEYPVLGDLLDASTGPRTRGSLLVDGKRSIQLLSEDEIKVASRSELQEKLRHAQALLQRIHAHAMLADDEILVLRGQLNSLAKQQKRKHGALRTKARGLTGAQYRDQLNQQRRDRRERDENQERRDKERAARKIAKEDRNRERQSKRDRLAYALSHPPKYSLSCTELRSAKGSRLNEIIHDLNELTGCRVLKKSGAIDIRRQSIADYLRLDLASVSDNSNIDLSDKENTAQSSDAGNSPQKRRRTRSSGCLNNAGNAV